MSLPCIATDCRDVRRQPCASNGVDPRAVQTIVTGAAEFFRATKRHKLDGAAHEDGDEKVQRCEDDQNSTELGVVTPNSGRNSGRIGLVIACATRITNCTKTMNQSVRFQKPVAESPSVSGDVAIGGSVSIITRSAGLLRSPRVLDAEGINDLRTRGKPDLVVRNDMAQGTVEVADAVRRSDQEWMQRDAEDATAMLALLVQ
jgi:hypothetical protein